MNGRLENSSTIYLDDIELNIRGMLIRGHGIETPEDLNRLREAVQTLDGITARVERKLSK